MDNMICKLEKSDKPKNITDLLSRYIGKEIYVDTDNDDWEGTLTEIVDNWILLVDKDNNKYIINLKHVECITANDE